MADENLDAEPAQPLDVGAVGLVGAAHLVAEIDQHFGDAAHANPADADEMDGAEFVGKLHAAGFWRIYASRATRKTRSAKRSAASAFPVRLALDAIAESCAGSPKSCISSCASRSDVKSVWRTSIAPPAAASAMAFAS